MSDPRDDDPRPAEPIQPDLDDCCGSGCTPCVFDVYDEQREAWQAAMRAWRARQATRQAASTDADAGLGGGSPAIATSSAAADGGRGEPRESSD